MKLTQAHRSVLALIFTAAFLITGKLFVWKQDDAAAVQPDDLSDSAAEQFPDETTFPVTTVTTAESTTTTVTTAITDHFEFYSPEESASDITEMTVSEEAVPELTTITEPTDLSGTDGMTAAPEGYFSDALFIGDSRTVGQACYAPIDGATYFATVGLSTYKIDEALSEVPGTEGWNFASVLGMKQYGKVYIMLGINEVGSDFGTTAQNMRALIDKIRAVQPNAIIYLEANLHVSALKHYSDAVINNTRINALNAEYAAIADGDDRIFYVDANPIFDDAEGCMTAEYTSDGVHPYAKHYAELAAFLREHAVVQ